MRAATLIELFLLEARDTYSHSTHPELFAHIMKDGALVGSTGKFSNTGGAVAFTEHPYWDNYLPSSVQMVFHGDRLRTKAGGMKAPRYATGAFNLFNQFPSEDDHVRGAASSLKYDKHPDWKDVRLVSAATSGRDRELMTYRYGPWEMEKRSTANRIPFDRGDISHVIFHHNASGGEVYDKHMENTLKTADDHGLKSFIMTKDRGNADRLKQKYPHLKGRIFLASGGDWKKSDAAQKYLKPLQQKLPAHMRVESADLLISRVLCEDRMPGLHKRWGETLNIGHDDGPRRLAMAAAQRGPEVSRVTHAINHIAQHADPTPNKEYTDRLLSWYHKGQFRIEDAPRIHSALKSFHALRRGFGPEHAQQAGLDIKNPKDIGSYKSLHDLEHMVRVHSQAGSAVLSPEQHQDIERGSRVIHDSPQLRVREIHTKAAACALGNGTEWCTAHPDDRYNRFTAYNAMGKLYHIHDKETGEVHQVHFESGQLMDKNDKDADPNALMKKHPVLGDLFYGRHADIFTDRKRLLNDVAKDPQAQILAKVENSRTYQDHHEMTNAGGHLGRTSKDPEELHQIALHGNWAAKLAVADNDFTAPHTLEHLSSAQHTKVAERVATHPLASAKALSNIVDTIHNHRAEYQAISPDMKRAHDNTLISVGEHKNTDLATRMKLMQSDNLDVLTAALHGSRSANQAHPPMDEHPELLDAAVRHPSSSVKAIAMWSPKLTADHMRQLTSDMKSLSTLPAKHLASRKDLPVDVQHKLASHWDHAVSHELLANKDLDPEVVTKLSQSRNPGTVARAIYHHKLPDEHRKAAVKRFPHLADHYAEMRSAVRAGSAVTWRNFGGLDWDWMD